MYEKQETVSQSDKNLNQNWHSGLVSSQFPIFSFIVARINTFSHGIEHSVETAKNGRGKRQDSSLLSVLMMSRCIAT